MKTDLLVIDVSNLCYRAYHAIGAARGDAPGSASDVAYSFLHTLVRLRKHFGTERFAFCFDHPVSYRKQIFAEYKQKRHEVDPEAAKKRAQLHQQIIKLGKLHLPMLGFSNIFRARGMESDDLMAAIAFSPCLKDDQIVLVTSDNDLLQCLRKNVVLYSPATRKVTTRDNFMETYGIEPKQWADVKAMAGCATDGVPGILGVGEQGAMKFLRGELKPTSSQYIWITCKKGQRMIAGCSRLVKLPFTDCPVPDIQEDDRISWERIDRIRL